MDIVWITMTQRERRKVESPEAHKRSKAAKRVTGVKAKLYLKQRHAEKIHMKKTIKMHEKRNTKQKRMMKRLHKEWYLHIYWAERDSHELKFFPI